MGIIFSHMQSSVCKLVTRGPNRPTGIFSSQCFLFLHFRWLPKFEIGEISNKTLDLGFLLKNLSSAGAFIPLGGHWVEIEWHLPSLNRACGL